MDEEKLKREIDQAVLVEKINYDINETKKRVVYTAKTYDQFRNLVRCAETGQKAITSTELRDLATKKTNFKPREYTSIEERARFDPFLSVLLPEKNYKPFNGVEDGFSSNQ